MVHGYVSLEVKSVAEDGTIEGYASTFGNTDHGNDIMERGSFSDTLREHKAAGTMPAMLWNHKEDEPIGEWTEMREDKEGLYVKGKIWVNSGMPNAEKAYRVAKSNSQRGLSIGFKSVKAASDKKSGARRVQKVILGEVSIVPRPMNEKAKITSVKSDSAIHSLIRDIQTATSEAKASLKSR